MPDADPKASPDPSALLREPAPQADKKPKLWRVVVDFLRQRPEFLRMAVNLLLLVLCALAALTFVAVHFSTMATTGGLISTILGSTVTTQLVTWALKRHREKHPGEIEEIEGKAHSALESPQLSRWLLAVLAILVLGNLAFLPQDKRSFIDAWLHGKPVKLRIVPGGNLYRALAVMQGSKDGRFDLLVRRLKSHGKPRPDDVYRLKTMGPGNVYTGAARKDLELSPTSDPSSAGPQLDSDAIQGDSRSTTEKPEKIQYLETDVFRQHDEVAIEVQCVNIPGSRTRTPTLAKIDVLLEEPPVQTVTLNAQLENNPCIPPG